MGDVVWGLEFALQLQQTAEKNPNSVDWINMEEKSSLSPHRGVMASDEDDMFSGAESHSRSTFSTDAASVTLSDPVQRASKLTSQLRSSHCYLHGGFLSAAAITGFTSIHPLHTTALNGEKQGILKLSIEKHLALKTNAINKQNNNTSKYEQSQADIRSDSG
uniref:Uncharacterized protein n=1 Tax=Salix viminalis TaxID=40686 RepID=A0A6N2N0D7_SALVM